MKFMIHWSSSTDSRHDTYKAFAQMSEADDQSDHAGVTVIGRWHDLVAGGGVAICESDDLLSVQAWAMNWNGVLDVDIRPVADDDEARTMLKKKWDL